MRVSKFKELANLENWKEMIASRVASNLSVSAWCKQNNLTEQQYYYRLNKVRQAAIEDAEVSDIAQPIRCAHTAFVRPFFSIRTCRMFICMLQCLSKRCCFSSFVEISWEVHDGYSNTAITGLCVD